MIASLDESGKKTAIIIDEIAYFFLAFAQTSQNDADAFAYKLRALQLAHENVRWLLTGSIGLDIIARRYELEGAFVDFDHFELQPFTSEEARSFLRDAAIQQQLNRVQVSRTRLSPFEGFDSKDSFGSRNSNSKDSFVTIFSRIRLPRIRRHKGFLSGRAAPAGRGGPSRTPCAGASRLPAG